ncbi:unnamed protein product [Allacma fusca]|uniref:Uncharacterized protein n=1 Tax=Allacma fusca TaxID=39272 RepID=A0A8J2PQX9_9HEXA|nr:unnamed protein product [Allacma fusca]
MPSFIGLAITLYNDTRKVNFINKNETIRDTLPTKHFLPHWRTQILQIGNPNNLNSLLESFVNFGAPQRDKSKEPRLYLI